MMKLPFVWMFHKGGAARLGIAGGPRPQARAIRFRTSWRDAVGAKDQITEGARHPVVRRSQHGSWNTWLLIHARMHTNSGQLLYM